MPLLSLPSDVFPMVVVVLAVAAGLLWYVLDTRRRQRRVRALAALARRREWEFKEDGWGLHGRFHGEPFDRGSNQQIRNVVSGRHEGRDFLAFDQTYVTGSGQDRHTHTWSVVVLAHGLPATVRVPELQVSPQGPVGRWFTGLTGSDVVVGDPAVDDAVRIRTRHPEFARDVLRGGVVEVVRSHGGRVWRLDDSGLVTFASEPHRASDVEPLLAWASALLDRVPADVWARLRGDG